MNDNTMESTITERGQVSVPASLRRRARLKPGQKLVWHWVSDSEIRVTVKFEKDSPGPLAALGFARKFSNEKRLSSDDALRQIREGDKD